MTRALEKILLLLLIILLPSQLALHLWPPWAYVNGLPVDYLSPTLYFTDLLILGLLILSRAKVQAPLPVIVFAVLNILISLSPLMSLYKWLRLLEYFWLFKYLTYNLQPTTYNLPLSLSVLWTSLLAWAQFLRQRSLGGLWYWLGERPLDPALPSIAKVFLAPVGTILRPYGTFPHPNALAGFLLASGLIVYYLNSKNKSGLGIWSLIIAAATLPVTFSRSNVFIGLLITGFCLTRRIGTRLLPLLLPFFLLIVPPLLSLGSPASLPERLVLIHKSLFIIHKSPLLGLGLGTFPIFPYNLLLNFQPVHNIYLLLASELGLPAALVIGHWVIKSLRNCLEIRNWELVIPALVVLATGLSDHYWLTSHQNLLLLVLLFSLIKIESMNHERSTKPPINHLL